MEENQTERERGLALGALLLTHLRRVSTFLYLLIVLFTIQIVARIFSLWQGISVIVNIYLYVFSFYLIFIFSTIDLKYLKTLYRDFYKKKGDYILFSVTRLAPFALIFFVTAVFTTINYYGDTFWPWRPLLELLDGRFSNIVFYSLMLLVILKMKKEPRITIPLFLFISVIYFLVYKLVYTFSPSGLSISLLKYLQISVALFFLLNEFVNLREKIAKLIVQSLILGVAVYFSLVGIFIAFHRFSDSDTYRYMRSALILLKLGYRFPLEELQNQVVKTNNPYLLSTVIYYTEENDPTIPLGADRWETYLAAGNSETSNDIARYLRPRGIGVSCEVLGLVAERESERNGEALMESESLMEYTAWNCNDDFDPLIRRYGRGNWYYRAWFIRTASMAGSTKSIPLLMGALTGTDVRLGEEAYRALVTITGIDREGRYRGRFNDIDFITAIGNYVRDLSLQDAPR